MLSSNQVQTNVKTSNQVKLHNEDDQVNMHHVHNDYTITVNGEATQALDCTQDNDTNSSR